jgi:hypothetical protein
MNRTTILRIGAILGVVFGACWVLVLAAGSESERHDASAGMVAILFIGGLLLAGWRLKVLPRRDFHRAQARELRLRSAPGDPLHFLDRGFLLVRRVASVRDVENTSWGTWRGRDIAVFDYWLARTSEPSVGDYEYFTCVVTPVPETWPRLSISPERLETRLADALGMHDVDFELETFNRSFDVRTANQRFASAVIDARMMEWLLRAPRHAGFEILDGSLLCHVDRGIDLDIHASLDTLDGFLQRIPSVVHSLYPGTPSNEDTPESTSAAVTS